MNTERVDGERVHWKVDTFDRARCGVTVAVAAECGDLSLRDELERGRMQARSRVCGVPGSELLSPEAVADAHEQQITLSDAKLLRFLGGVMRLGWVATGFSLAALLAVPVSGRALSRRG